LREGRKGRIHWGKRGENFLERLPGEAKNRFLRGGKRGNHKPDVESRNQSRYASCMAKPSEVWDEVKARYLSGEELSTIASDLKLCVETVQTKASRTGLTKLRKQMQTVCIEKKTQSLESLSALVRSKLAEDAAATIERVNGYDLDGIRDESTREQILGSVAKRSALVFGWSETGEQASVSINLLGSMPDRIAEIQVTGEPDSK
jgi:hypothetical protein